MTFLPIVVRELRVASRRKNTYRTRFWTALTAIILAGYLVVVTEAASRGVSGRLGGTMVLTGLAGLCFLWCMSLAGNTVDCISEEKREGTLGFLFLTDLKGHDIALGKLFSTSVNSFYAILGVVPIVAVSILLGGIRAQEICEVALALLNAFFFSHATGILVSTLSRKKSTANFCAAALLLTYTLGLFLLARGLDGRRFGSLAAGLEVFNPAYSVFFACVMVMRNAGVPAPTGEYWTSLGLVHLNAWVFLAVASWWLPRSWQEKPRQPKVRGRARFLHWYHQSSAQRQQLLDTNPFLWIATRNRFGSIKIWIALFGLNCIWGWILKVNGFEQAGIGMFFTMIITSHLLLKVSMVADATDYLDEQRRNGGLEFLLSCTPLSVEEIVEGQWAALRRQFFKPLIGMLVFTATLAIIAYRRGGEGYDPDEKYGFAIYCLFGTAMLVADLIALGWLGMWNAMSQRKPRHAAGATATTLLAAPWIVFLLIVTASALLHVGWIEHFWFAFGLWFFLGIAADVPGFLFARHQLLTRFRELAAAPIGEPLGLFGHLGRLVGTWMRS